ncbi:hypothetical protein PG996_013473 [Apiospora saccharicola]|uniref:Uncharacterized protein n=1 Tax=Apiospora saccharicola TaxID=335842 RepID=A0ABR1U632_9PEZI
MLQDGCPNRGSDCVASCTDPEWIYSSMIEDNGNGDGSGPPDRYTACVNMPAIARASLNHELPPNISIIVDQYVARNITNQQLQAVTAAVTDCLSSTCRNSRDGRDGPQSCYHEYCSPTTLLTNNTAPNVTAINSCINNLCDQENYGQLPYADADIVGIGVFVSYLMQCGLLVVIWALLMAASLWPRKSPSNRVHNTDHERGKEKDKLESTLDLLDNFHKSQCYFVGSLMVAALAYGIFERNMLVVFMMIPLATNGVLPVVLTYLLLVYYRKSTKPHALLTMAAYTLSSVVYWILYRQLNPQENDPKDKRVYQQFMFKASDIPACKGYSGFTVCPENTRLGFDEVREASSQISNLTPIIWTFSTATLLGLLVYRSGLLKLVLRRFREWRDRDRVHRNTSPSAQQYSEVKTMEGRRTPSSTKTFKLRDMVFGIAMAICPAAMGMQLSLLTIAHSFVAHDGHGRLELWPDRRGHRLDTSFLGVYIRPNQ